MPDDEIAGLSVVVKAEVEQATKALTNLSRQFENTAMIAQEGAEVQEASFVDVERGMDHNLKQHKKHSEGVMGALKKIGGAWAMITGAATAGIYGLLRVSSYGSLYFNQWGAIMKDVANTAIKPLIPTLNDATNAGKKFADTYKKEGMWAAIKESGTELVTWLGEHLGITGAIEDATNAYSTFKDNVEDKGIVSALKIAASDLDTWYKEQNTITKVTIGLIAALTLAVGALILLFTGPVGLVAAIVAVGAALLTAFKWEWIKTQVSNFVEYIKNIEWPTIPDPFDIDWCAHVPDWAADILGICDTEKTWEISWPSIDTSGLFDIDWCAHIPDWIASILGICDEKKKKDSDWTISWPSIDTSGLFDIDWCAHIPGWVAYVLGICDEKKKTDWTITWPEMTNPFEGIFDPITDFTSEAATYGGNLIDNLVSGINAHKPSLEDAVSGITDTLKGIGSPPGTPSTPSTPRCPYGTYAVRNADGSFSHCEKETYRTGYHGGDFSSGSSSSTSTGSGVPQSTWEIVEGPPPFTQEEIDEMRNYDRGGYIPFTSPALVHAGEYVVPRGGTLVKEGGLPNVTINLTVNNGTQRDSKALADDISRIISTEIRRLVKA